MKDNYVDNDSMLYIIKSMNIENQQLYMNLYKNYNLLYNNYNLGEKKTNSFDLIDLDTKIKLRALEDKIYTINGRILTQKERIILELKNINRFVLKKGDRIPDKTKSIVFKELNELKSVMEKSDLSDKDIIRYFKKRISILQAYLGMNIKFFAEAFEVFYEQVLITRIKTKKSLHDFKTK